jgi:hypothetical protein
VIQRRAARAPDRPTDPVPRWGPTPVYGECEVVDCAATARTTCTDCAGEYCLGHRQHEAHRENG